MNGRLGDILAKQLRGRLAASVCLLAPSVAALAVLLGACAQQQSYTKETFVMGTKAWITIAGMRSEEAEQNALAAFREMYRIENVMSNWKSASEVSRLNHGSRGEPFAATRELFALVDSSLYYSVRTFGAFDVTVRPLVTLWGFEGGSAPRLPTDAEIAEAMNRVGYGAVLLDSASSTITLPPGVEIDLAGIAKGYAVDRCIAMLRERGVTNAFVNLGGNIFAIGSAPGHDGWPIGIRDPRGGTTTVGTIMLRNEAVATSGNYENFVEIDGKRYGHIIDPRTGRPVDTELSVTVVAPTGLESDALSTGFFVLGAERSAEALAALPGVKALFAVPRDARIWYTEIGDFGDALKLTDGTDVQPVH
jgi:thiamine biosynthesis lipoprotein